MTIVCLLQNLAILDGSFQWKFLFADRVRSEKNKIIKYQRQKQKTKMKSFPFNDSAKVSAAEPPTLPRHSREVVG
jgi:hypothetical protein